MIFSAQGASGMKVTGKEQKEMPMMTWLSMHLVDNAPSSLWWIAVGILIVGFILAIIIAIKFK